ncbi:MAG: CAP domain-containing protein, partial [Clostridia bacterium]|nr:CAP domain-containing protein [Clostridia bacterium]
EEATDKAETEEPYTTFEETTETEEPGSLEDETTAESDSAEETTEEPAEETTEEPVTESAPAETVCTHETTANTNAQNATCASEGYTGDEVCSLCGVTVKNGETIPKLSVHENTTIINAVEATTEAEGYTGDTVCTVCNAVVTEGKAIPKKEADITYIVCVDPYGNELTVPEGTDILDYSLEHANLPATTSKFAKLEAEILRLTNIEREKVGAPALKNEPRAYYFASVRAYEASVNWSHTRPNGESFHHILAENGVFYVNCAENLYSCTNMTTEQLQNDDEWINNCAADTIKEWLNSPSHRASLLDPTFTSISIGAYVDDATQEVYVVQLFFA